MTKSLFLLSLSSSLFFTACTSTSVVKYFEKEEFYTKAMQYTKKTDISKNNQVEIMLNATYLNSTEKKFNNNYQNFIVGIYNINDEEELGLNNKKYVLLLNGEKPEVINELEEQIYLNKVPLRNHWAKYYLVSFKKIPKAFFEEKTYKLILSYEDVNKRKTHLNLLEEIENENLEEKEENLKKAEESTSSWKASVSFLKEL
jgi:hypothetical protein